MAFVCECIEGGTFEQAKSHLNQVAFLFPVFLLALSFTVVTFFPEQATAEQDKENDKCADIKSEQSAIEKNHKQDYNPQDITTCIAFVWFMSAAATAKTTKTTK